MAKIWWVIVGSSVVLAGACGTGSQPFEERSNVAAPPVAASPAKVAPAERKAFATSPTALGPVGGDECRLLDDPKLRQRLSTGLERKLLVTCGRAPKTAQLTPPQASEKLPKRANVPQAGALSLAPGSDIPVSDPTLDTGGSTQSETSVVAVGNVVCAAWNDSGEGFGANGFAGFGYSLDGGQTFKDGGPFLASGDTSFGDPSLAYSVRDHAFYFASLSSSGLSLWRSLDSCQSFQYVGVIHSSFGDDKEMIAVDNTPTSPFFGRIHIGWTAFGEGNDINVASFSDNGGVSWSPMVHLPGSGQSGQGVYPAVAPNGDVYMAFVFQDFSVGGHQDQWIYRSTNGGSSWVKGADIGTDQLRPEDDEDSMDCGRQALGGHIRNLSSPQIVVTADGAAPAGYVIHAVYPYDSDGSGPDHSNVFYRRSADGGASWSAEVRLNDDTTNTDQFYPAIGASEDGILAVSFYDRRLDATNNYLIDRYLTVSTDGGGTWSPNERISDVSAPVAQTLPNFDGLATCYHGDYDQVAVSGNVAHIVWADDRRTTESGPNPDVYYDQFVVNPHLGRLSATRPAVSCSGSIGFGLSDSDLAGVGTQAIALTTTTGDSETLVLTEDASRPGKFSGSITTTQNPAVAGNGVLDITDLATITATYEDADDGSGNPATATLEVRGDCAPPTLSNVHVAALGGTAATLAADSSESATLTAEYGFSCDALALTATGSPSAHPTVALGGLYEGFTYYYALTATDAYGNTVRDDNGGSCYSFTTLSVLLRENFESGLGDFEIPAGADSGGTGGTGSAGTGGTGATGGTVMVGGAAGTGGRGSGGRGSGGVPGTGGGPAAGTAGTFAGAPEEGGAGGEAGGGGTGTLGGGLWHLTETCAATSIGHTRPSALYFGLDSSCTFENGTTVRGVVLSPALTLTDSSFASVEFDYFLGTEGGGFYDQASLEISIDDGPFQVVTSNFTTLLEPEPDAPATFRTREGARPAGRFTLTENSGKWQHSVTDLTSYLAGLDGATIRLRFHFDSIDPVANQFAGFYVDDVTIYGIAPKVPCTADAECDDGRFCTGNERCEAGFCAKGTPVVCSGSEDGIPCTTFACDETARGCTQVAHDDLCDDGLFCNGLEICNLSSGCQAGVPVTCPGGDVSCVVGQCSESIHACTQLVDNSVCDDGSFCDGFEYCDPTLGCQQTPPPCVDSVACTDDVCDEATFSCAYIPNDSRCNDGLFCDGAEYCDGYAGCRSSGPACTPNEKCDESGDQCIPVCFTDTNVNHQGAGRATSRRGSYYAKGSNDALGKGTVTTSLQGGGNYWIKVPSCPAPPTIDAVSVAISGTNATVSGTASDPNGDIVKVRVTFYVYLYFPATLDATGTSNFAGTLSLPPGVHAATVQAVDAAGYVSAPSEPVYFEILSPQPPTVDSVEVAVSGGKVTVSGTASDVNNDITKVQITILKDGAVVVAPVATGTTSFSATLAGLAPGSYAARAQAFDSFGFTSTLSAPIPFEITAQCVADTNAHHVTAGRALLKKGTYYAVGSQDSLGKKPNQTTALSGSDGYWSKVASCP